MSATRRLHLLISAILALSVFSGFAMGAFGFDGGIGSKKSDDYEEQAEGYQDEIDDIDKDRAAAEKRAEELEHQLEDTDAKIVEADRKLRELNERLPALQAALEDAEEEVQAAIVQQGIIADKLAAAEAQDRAITEQIAADEQRTEELEALVAAIARETYKGADLTASLAIVFDAVDTQQFVDEFTAQQSAARVQTNALAELEEIAAVNRNRGARQEAVREYIVELKAEADALVIELRELRDAAEVARDDVQALLDEQEELRAYLESQRAAFVAQQKENEALQEQLRNDVLSLYAKKREAEEKAEAARKAEEEAARKAAEGNKPSTGGGTLGKGTLSFPTKVPYKTSSFGMRYHPIYHYPRLHAGVDLRAYCGTPIYAAAGGTVEWATYKPGYGNQVLIDHGLISGKSIITNYNHLSRFAVRTGQTVARGDLLGYSGNTGSSTACHLHFEVYVSGKVVDPETLLPNFP